MSGSEQEIDKKDDASKQEDGLNWEDSNLNGPKNGEADSSCGQDDEKAATASCNSEREMPDGAKNQGENSSSMPEKGENSDNKASENGGGAPPGNTSDSSEAPGKKSSENGTDNEEGMGLLDHLAELRRCLTRACIWAIIGFGACWAFVDPIFDLLVNPLLAILPAGTHAQYTTLPEAFFTRVYVAFVAGLFLSSPAIFYQIWAFVAPGLYEEEKRWILPIALLSAIFFIAGAVFCYFIVFPFAFSFFISYSTPEIVITPKVSDYLNFVIKLLFAFGLIFEMPIFTFFLARFGIITAAMMRRARKYAIVGIFILAAILTPPDVVSQLLMAVPMLLLYEISIGVAAIFGKKKETDAKSAESGEKDDG